jgi:hypothetical protein
MSWHATAWAKAQTVAPSGDRITRSEKLLLLCIADYHNAEKGYAWPSVDRLATEAMMSDRHVRNLLNSLTRKGLVEVEHRTGDTNRYRLPAMPGEEVWTARATVAPAPSPAPVADPPAQVSAKELAAGLAGPEGVIDGYLADADAGRITLAEAYQQALADADALAVEFAGTSPDLRGHLRNAVVARCAADVHGVEPKSFGRLSKEAKVLGVDGHRWLVSALLHTASAAITGDPVSYVVRTARRMAAERQAVAA